MSAIPVTYPATPKNIDERVIQPSSTFKQEVTKVLTAILFFIAVYITLMAAAILLAVLCGYGGIMLIAVFPKIITLMIGLGLVGLGGMVIFFLLKFLFKRNKTDRSHLIEITEQEQPELFKFIRTLTAETQSPFPKKIYLSADVNACVFYDSSFWSMFFPVRKNLQIGLGLVNAVNLSEFKAIMAHEFGHFSQRSMKLGSYVYNVNQVIYNMLYDNEGYGETLDRWANINGYFAFFAGITVRIVQGIQWVLQQVYSIVNKSYMSLSRQMEFHADAVAAYVTGSDHLVTSLRRLEVADICYNKLFDCYNNWYKENLKPDNIYPQHSEMMKQFANDHDLPLRDNLPQVTAESFAYANKARVVIKNQWASHPSTDDREEHLNQLAIRTETVHTSAWVLFQNPELLQQQVTNKIYSTVTFQETPSTLDVVSFRERFQAENEKFILNKRYKGFFNSRAITVGNLTDLEAISETLTLDDLLTEQVIRLPYLVDGLKSDISILEMIQQEKVQIKTFEFSGTKYEWYDAGPLLVTIKQELIDSEAELAQADRRLIAFFVHHASRHGQGEKIKADYARMFEVASESEEDIKKFVDLRNIINPIFHGNLSLEQVTAIVNQIRFNEEPIKARIRKFLDDKTCAAFYSEEDKAKLIEYCSKDHEYFTPSVGFLDNQVTLFNEATALFYDIAFNRSLKLKKELLDWQLTFVA